MFFEEQVSVRLRKEEIRAIDDIMDEDPERYDSRSHYIRVVVLRALKEHGGKQHERKDHNHEGNARRVRSHQCRRAV